MSRKKKQKTQKKYYIIIAILLICSIALIIDKYELKKVKDIHDIDTAIAYETIPHDKLLKDYDSYKKFLKNNLSKKNYLKELENDTITEKSFRTYDYVAIFYKSQNCSDTGDYPKSLTQFKDRIVLSVVRHEKKKCNTSIRISFIPVDKDKYSSIPNVVVKKEIVKK